MPCYRQPDAADLGPGARLPVQDLPGRRHPGVPDQRAGQIRRLGAEQAVMVGADDADRGQRHPPTVRETAVPELLDTPASQHLFQAVAACRKSRSGPVRAGA